MREVCGCCHSVCYRACPSHSHGLISPMVQPCTFNSNVSTLWCLPFIFVNLTVNLQLVCLTYSNCNKTNPSPFDSWTSILRSCHIFPFCNCPFFLFPRQRKGDWLHCESLQRHARQKIKTLFKEKDWSPRKVSSTPTVQSCVFTPRVADHVASFVFHYRKHFDTNCTNV